MYKQFCARAAWQCLIRYIFVNFECRKLAKPHPPSSAFQLQMVAGFIVLSLLCYSIPMEFQYLLPLRFTFLASAIRRSVVDTFHIYTYYIQNKIRTCVPSTIPLLISSKLAQIGSSFQAGSTGQLSSISTFLTFAGCLVRSGCPSVET